MFYVLNITLQKLNVKVGYTHRPPD